MMMFASSNFLPSNIITGTDISTNQRFRLYFSYCHCRQTTTTETNLLSNLYPTTTTTTTTPTTPKTTTTTTTKDTETDPDRSRDPGETLTCDNLCSLIDHRESKDRTESNRHDDTTINSQAQPQPQSSSEHQTECSEPIRDVWRFVCQPNIILALLALITYWPSLWAELVFDDRPAIIDNQDLRPETPWSHIWYNDYWGMAIKSSQSHKSYRPLTVITFRLNYMIHQLQPFGYHLINVILHIIVTILFHKLCQSFLSYPGVQHEPRSTSVPYLINNKQNNNNNIQKLSTTTKTTTTICQRHHHHFRSTPFWMAAIFAVHPIHTECVASVVGRAELLSAIFYIGSILLWYNHHNNSHINHHCSNYVPTQLLSSTTTRATTTTTRNGKMNNNHNNHRRNNQNHHHHHHHHNKNVNDDGKLLPLLLLLSSSSFGQWWRYSLCSWWWWCDKNKRFISVMLALFGFLCKEQCIFVLAYLILHQLMCSFDDKSFGFYSPSSSSSLSTLSSTTPLMIKLKMLQTQRANKFLDRVWPKLRSITLLVAIFLLVIYIRFIWIGHSFPTFNRFDNPASRALFPVKQLTYGYVALYHYWLMLYPNQLSCDWTHSSIELIDFTKPNGFHSADMFRFLLVVFVFCFMAINVFYLLSSTTSSSSSSPPSSSSSSSGATWLLIRKQRSRPTFSSSFLPSLLVSLFRLLSVGSRNGFKARFANTTTATNTINRRTNGVQVHLARKVLNALALTFIPFLPVSNIFFPVGFVIAERVLYLPSIGFLLLFGLGIDYLLLYLSQKQPTSDAMAIHCHKSWNVAKNGKDSETTVPPVNAHHHPHRYYYYWCCSKTVLNVSKMFGKYRAKKPQNHANWLNILLSFTLLTFAMKTFHRSNSWSDELHLFRSGLEVNPRNIKLLNNLGRLHERHNRTNLAIQLYRKAMTIEPKDLRSYLNLGNILAKNNEIKSAKTLYRRALAIVDEDDDFPMRNLLLNQEQQFDSEQFSLSPLYLTALIRLAELLNDDPELTNLEELNTIHQKILKLQTMVDPFLKFPDKPTSAAPSCDSKCDHVVDSKTLDQLYNLAIVHYRSGNSEQALRYFEQVLTFDPDHVNSLRTSARIIRDENLSRLRNVAINRLQKLVNLKQADEYVYFDLAMFAIHNEKFVDARRWLEMAISENDHFLAAHYNLALLLIKQINYLEQYAGMARIQSLLEAIEHLKRVLAIDPKHQNSMLVLGELYAEEFNQLDLSRYYYQRILSTVNPNNVEARHNLCILWHKSNNIDRSIECLKDLLENRIPMKHSIDPSYSHLIQNQLANLIKFRHYNSTMEHHHQSHQPSMVPGTTTTTNKRSTVGSMKSTATGHLNMSSDFNNLNVYKNLFTSQQHFSTMCII